MSPWIQSRWRRGRGGPGVLIFSFFFFFFRGARSRDGEVERDFLSFISSSSRFLRFPLLLSPLSLPPCLSLSLSLVRKRTQSHLGPQRQAQQQRERVQRREHLSEDVVHPLWSPEPCQGRAAEQRQGDEIAQDAVGVVDGDVAPGRDGPGDFFTGQRELQGSLQPAEGGEVRPGLPVERGGPRRRDPLQADLGGPGVEEGRGGVELGDSEPAGGVFFF